MDVSLLMLVPITVVALAVGLLGLKLIAMMFNGIFGYPASNRSNKPRNVWSPIIPKSLHR